MCRIDKLYENLISLKTEDEEMLKFKNCSTHTIKNIILNCKKENRKSLERNRTRFFIYERNNLR